MNTKWRSCRWILV